jgi:hypothetical protein
MAYKFRERRRPRELTRADVGPVYFERVDLTALKGREGNDA